MPDEDHKGISNHDFYGIPTPLRQGIVRRGRGSVCTKAQHSMVKSHVAKFISVLFKCIRRFGWVCAVRCGVFVLCGGRHADAVEAGTLCTLCQHPTIVNSAPRGMNGTVTGLLHRVRKSCSVGRPGGREPGAGRAGRAGRVGRACGRFERAGRWGRRCGRGPSGAGWHGVPGARAGMSGGDREGAGTRALVEAAGPRRSGAGGDRRVFGK